MTKPKRDPATWAAALRYVARLVRLSARDHNRRCVEASQRNDWKEMYTRGQCYGVLNSQARRFELEARAAGKKGK